MRRPSPSQSVQYVKICSLYGAGFYYIPGTDTCIKIGGYVRAEADFNANGSYNPFRSQNFDDPAKNDETTRVRYGITADVRSQTEYGTLRGYLTIFPTATNGTAVGGSPYEPIFAPAGFIQFAGFTAGKTASFFDFDLQPYSNITNFWGSNQAGNGIPLLAYTAQFGNGFSASLSVEDTTVRRSAVVGPIGAGGTSTYAGREWPDIVANLHVDQAWGSAQIMGAVHDVTGYTATTVATSSATGWAVGGGVKFNLPMIGKGDYVITQVEWAKGALNYLGSNFGTGAFGETLSNGYPTVTSAAVGPVYDAVGNGTGYDLGSGWSITGGFEHHWVPNWKTSLYGSYGKIEYSQAASTAIAGVAGIAAGPAATADAGWSYWNIGSRTVWTVVPNLDLSVDVVYQSGQTAFGGLPCAGTAVATGSALAAGCTFQDKSFWAGIVRAQRNFYP